MQRVTPNRFHPKRWTALTWLAVFLWTYDAYVGNWPHFEMRTVDSVTGEFSDPIRYERLRDLPYPVGWPLYYVTPSYLFPPLPVRPAGTPLPPPAPSRVSAFAMVANFVLVAITMSALVYFLQKTRYQYSLLFLLAIVSAIPVYFALGRLVVILAGGSALKWYAIAVYSSPIPAALAVRYSILQGWNWPRSRLLGKGGRRSFDDYDNPDDAIAAARKLDWRGDWAASTDLYRHIAERWPEHAGYMQQCIDGIAEKRSLAQT